MNLDYLELSELTNISRIWLNGNAITNVGFVVNMPQLTALGLDNNAFADPSPLGSLTNLALLSLSQNLIPDYDWLTNSAFAGLASLRLEGNSIGNMAAFLTSLPQLSFLSLNNNRVTGMSALSGLTNLSSLYLAQNRVCGIDALTGLPQLRFVDVSLNLLETSAAQLVAPALQCPWVNIGEARVRYLPTDRMTLAVDLATAPEWHIPANRSRSLTFFVSDDMVPSWEWSVAVASANDQVIPNASITINGSDGTRTVTLSAAAVAAPTNTFLTFSAQNSPCGLSVTTNIHVLVYPPDPEFSLPDPSLSNQVCEALGQPEGELTRADMLSLVSLFAAGAGIHTLSGLEWATNLTTLTLDNNVISNLTPISSLWSLTHLSLYGNLITDLLPPREPD